MEKEPVCQHVCPSLNSSQAAGSVFRNGLPTQSYQDRPVGQSGHVFFRLAAFIVLCAFFLPIQPVKAEDSAGKPADELVVGLGGGIGVSPYRNYDMQWLPYPILSYNGEYAYIRGFRAGIKIINLDFMEFSAFAGYDPTSFDTSDTSNRRLKRLHNRQSSADLGLSLDFFTPYGMLHGDLAGDVLGHSDGFHGSLGYTLSVETGPLEFLPTLGTYWASSNYNDYYYGVSGSESSKSGLEAYQAGSGFSPYLGLRVEYVIDGPWEIFCSGELVWLSDEIRDSPMVSRSHTLGLNTGLSYTF